MSARHEALFASLILAACVVRVDASPQARAAAAQPHSPAIVADSGPGKPVGRTSECVVSKVIDGDTIECRDIGRVRLIGIDAPESNQKPFGAASTGALRSLLASGQRVQLEHDAEARDRYGRTLAYVWADGRMVNWLLMRSGWTVLLTVPPNVQHLSEFRTAQDRARAEHLGLWRVDGFKCLPADHRKQRC